MKFFGFLILTILIVVFANPFIPYWGVMVALALLAILLNPGNAIAFWGGGLGMGLSWLGLSLYLSIQTGSPLPEKIASIFGVGSGTILIGVTGLLGFLFGAFSSLTGSLFRKITKKRPDNLYRGG